MLLADLRARPAYALYRFLWTALDWLYPPYCGGCAEPGERWCEKCRSQASRLGELVCMCCGQPQSEAGKTCPLCSSTPPSYAALRSWAAYEGPLREAVQRLKYRRDIGLGEVLSLHLIEQLHDLAWQIDLVMPVPLSMKRLRQRGYNQASLLARPVALALKIPYSTSALLRQRDTASQVGLSAHERLENVRGAFSANTPRVGEKRILIIDDVTTTGATIQACALALLEAGAHSVHGLTLARALLHSDQQIIL